jgi:hypothetical protein
LQGVRSVRGLQNAGLAGRLSSRPPAHSSAPGRRASCRAARGANSSSAALLPRLAWGLVALAVQRRQRGRDPGQLRAGRLCHLALQHRCCLCSRWPAQAAIAPGWRLCRAAAAAAAGSRFQGTPHSGAAQCGARVCRAIRNWYVWGPRRARVVTLPAFVMLQAAQRCIYEQADLAPKQVRCWCWHHGTGTEPAGASDSPGRAFSAL